MQPATNEDRTSKRNFEHKLALNKKSDSKSFYAYVRSKQNVRDKLGRERTYVPRYRCSPNLCSPVPMFPGTDVPR